ncbi:MAG: hypothetical protein WD041_00350 [Nitriliruptoraceae bacterium]
MARVPYLDAEDLTEQHRHLLDERPINLRRAMANLPALAAHYAAIAEWFRFEAEVDTRARELGILVAAYGAGNAYAFCQHVEIGARFGVTDGDIDALCAFVNGHPVDLDAQDLLVMRTAQSLSRDAILDDDLWEGLVETFGQRGAMELCLVISHYNYVVRMLASLRMDVEPELAPALERFDPPAAIGSWR